MRDVNANIGINFDTTTALAQLRQLQAGLSRFNQSLVQGNASAANAQKALNAQLAQAINSTGKFVASQKTISSSTAAFTTALEKNQLSLKQYFRYSAAAATSNTQMLSKAFASEREILNRAFKDRVKALQSQYIQLNATQGGFVKAMQVMPRQLMMANGQFTEYATRVQLAAQRQQILSQLIKQGSTQLLNYGKNMQWAGRQLMVGLTIPLTMFAAAASRAFRDMEKATVDFKRVYGDALTSDAETAKAVENVKRIAMEYTNFGIAVKDTMAMAAKAAAAGFQGEALTQQVTQANKLSVLGQIDQQKALETTITLQNAFGVSTKDLGKTIDFLNAVENQTVLSLDDITTAIPKVGPVVKQLGGNVQDLAFFLTAMRENGVSASQAANALKSGLASMINPTKKASDMLAGFGINIKGIVEKNSGNLTGTVYALAKSLDTLAPLDRARAIEQLFGKFQFARISALFSSITKDGSQAARVFQLIGRSSEEMAILSQREMSKVKDAVGVKFQAAVEKFKTQIMPIGKAFLEAVTPIVTFFGKIFDKFNNLSDNTKKVVTVITAVLAGIGPVALMTFGLLANGFANLIKMFAALRMGLAKLTGQNKIVGGGFDYLTQTELENLAQSNALHVSHRKLVEVFNVEKTSVMQLAEAYSMAASQAKALAVSSPGLFAGGKAGAVKAVAKLSTGINRVPGPEGAGDIFPAMLAPGESVIPAEQSKKYGPLISGIMSDSIPGYVDGVQFVGMPQSFKETQKQRFEMEKIQAAFNSSRFATERPTNFGHLMQPFSGHSFPIPGIGGVYRKPSGEVVVVKPVVDERAALAEVRATRIARDVHGLNAPEQSIRTMIDPTDPMKQRKLIVLESPHNMSFAKPTGHFTQDEYIKQLVASSLRGDKDLQMANLSGRNLVDVGPAGVFGRASGFREFASIPSMEEQALINVLGVKGGAKKFFAQTTQPIVAKMTADEFEKKILKEINTVLPKLKKTVASFNLSAEEKIQYENMINRLEAGKNANWKKVHEAHIKAGTTSLETKGKLIAVGDTGIGFEGKVYNAKTAKGAKSVLEFAQNKLRLNPDGTYTYINPSDPTDTTKPITKQRLQDILAHRSAGGDLSASQIERSLVVGGGRRGSGEGSSAPSWMKTLAKEASADFAKEASIITRGLELRGFKNLTPEQVKNLTNVQMAHLEKMVDPTTGKKVWTPTNLAADLGYPNNYLNIVEKGLGKELLAKSAQELATLSTGPIDKNILQKLVGGSHPVTKAEAETLRNIARYQIDAHPNASGIYQAHAVDLGLGYRLKKGFYSGQGLQTLAQRFKSNPKIIEVLAQNGEVIENVNTGKRTVITSKNSTAKALNERAASGSDTRKVIIDPSKERIVKASRRMPTTRFMPGANNEFDATGARGGLTSQQMQRAERKALEQMYKQDRIAKIQAEAVAKEARVAELRVKQQAAEERRTQKLIYQQEQTAQMQNEAARNQRLAYRAELARKMGRVSGPVSATLGTAAMGSMMMGGSSAMTGGLFAASAVGSIIPMLANPMSAAAIALVGVAGFAWKIHSDLKNAVKDGQKLGNAMAMGADGLQKLAVVSNTVSATEEAAMRRKNQLNPASGVKREYGQTVLGSDFGQNIITGIEQQLKMGYSRSDVAKSLAGSLSNAIIQGIVTTEQARDIAAGLGEKLKSYDIPVMVSGEITKLFGPNGENLQNEPLKVIIQANLESQKRQETYFANAAAGQRAPINAGNVGIRAAGAGTAIAGAGMVATGMGAFGATAAGAAAAGSMGAGLANIWNPVGWALIATSVALIGKGIWDAHKVQMQNNKLNAAALQMSLNEYQNNQNNLDAINKIYDTKLKTAQTDSEIATIEKDRKDALNAINAQNEKNLQYLIKQKSIVGAGVFNQAIGAQAATLYKEGPMKVFADQATQQLGGMQESQFKSTLQIEFATGALDPTAVLSLIDMAKNNKNIPVTFDAALAKRGGTVMNQLIQLLSKAGASADTITTYLDFAKGSATDAELQKTMNTIGIIADMGNKYGFTIDINGAAGANKVKSLQAFIDTLDKYKGDVISKDVVMNAAKSDPTFKAILDNWKTLVGGSNTITKTMIIDFKAAGDDTVLQTYLTAKGLTNLNQYLTADQLRSSYGAEAQAWAVKNPQKLPGGVVPGAGNTGSGNGSKQDPYQFMLERLKEVRDAAINASGGLKELLRVAGKGKDIKIFEGMNQQLMKSGASQQFIDWLGSLDDKTRKTFMNIKNGKVILTDAGKAMQKAFDEAIIGDFNNAQKQTIREQQSQIVAYTKLAALGYKNSEIQAILSDKAFATAVAEGKVSDAELKTNAALTRQSELRAKILSAVNSTREAQQQADNIKRIPEVIKYLTQMGVSYKTVMETVNDAGKLDTAITAMDTYKDASAEVKSQLDEILQGLKNIDAQKLTASVNQMSNLQKVQAGYDAAQKLFDVYRKIDENTIKNSQGNTYAGLQKMMKESSDQAKIYQDQIAIKQVTLDAMQKAIDTAQRNVEMQYTRPIETLNRQIETLNRNAEIQFNRPLKDLQDRGTILSNDLTIIDHQSQAINDKYDAQIKALDQISQINQDLIAQEKQRISLADALTQGDISAAAQAMQDARAQASQAAQGRSAGILEAARTAELGALTGPQSGLTAKQIAEEQYQIGKKTYQLEQQKAAVDAQILKIQDDIYNKEQARQKLLDDIQKQEDAIYQYKVDQIDPIQKQLDTTNAILTDYQLQSDLLLQQIDHADNIRNISELTREQWDLLLASATAADDLINGDLATALALAESVSGKIATSWKAIQDAYDAIKDKSITITQTIKTIYEGGTGGAGGGGNISAADAVTAITNATTNTDVNTAVNNAVKAGATPSAIANAMANTLIKNGQDTASALSSARYTGQAIAWAKAQEEKLAADKAATANYFDKLQNVRQRAMSMGGMVKPRYFAAGGFNPIGTDIVPAMLTPGEFIISKTAVDKIGVNNLKNINSGTYNSGSVYNYSVGINVSGNNLNADDIAKAVMDEIKYIDSQRIRSLR